MYKKWKSVAALGMAVLIGCMMPMSTMMAAAEDSQEDVQESEMDSVSDDEDILDDENAGDEENVDDENVGDEVNADEDENTGDEVNEDDENTEDVISADEYADDEVNTDNDDIAVMSETEGSETGDTETLASVAAPEIEIKWQGESYICSLGGKIEFIYVNNGGQAFECSASQAASLSYCLEQVYPNDVAKDEGWMKYMTWQDEQPSFRGDAHYVLYVKAVGADGQTTYARSGGIVVDTQMPVVTGVEDGKSYPEGTQFKVEDNNLESVTVNEKPVTPAPDGSYQVSANGTSCVIKAKDKAGNETTYSITITRDPAENVISESGIYPLKAGISYQLAEGQWQVSGDKSVYSGSSTFYVKEDGDYTFTKR
ncbi:MAG: hypothetical protein K2N82_05075 [Lachnospiraceae bacterium]|nr:hypothetical protein [Lachnospiraceae bacterium]